MIHQDRVYIEYQHKQADGRWVLTEFTQVDEILTLPSIQLEIPVALIYERADWLAA